MPLSFFSHLTVVLCLLISAPVFGQSGTSIETLPRSAAERTFESADGGKGRSLSEFAGKALLLIVIGQDSSDAGFEQQVQMTTQTAGIADIVRVVIADVKGVPFFVKGAVRSGIRKAHQKGNAAIEAALKGKYAPAPRFLTLLDWGGDTAKQLGIGGKTGKTYHLYVISPAGAILLHLRQGENGLSEEAIRARALPVLEKAARR